MNQPVNSADALDELKLQYEQAKAKKLNLNMSRGKPAPSQLDLSNGLPLRYNNDKQKKPLFSRGLSVCRLLFNSFSKLKIDENYKEKRRLFY